MAEKIVEGDDGQLRVSGESEPEARAEPDANQDWERTAADTDQAEDMEGEAPTG